MIQSFNYSGIKLKSMKEKEAFVRHFREVQPKFSRLCMRKLVQSGLTMPQYALLNLIVAGPVPMKELNARLLITKPAVTNLVDRLEKHGFLRRAEEARDRRVTMIEIRTKGQKLIRDMQTTALSVLLRALEKFSASEKTVITRFHEVLSNCFDQDLMKSKGTKK